MLSHSQEERLLEHQRLQSAPAIVHTNDLDFKRTPCGNTKHGRCQMRCVWEPEKNNDKPSVATCASNLGSCTNTRKRALSLAVPCAANNARAQVSAKFTRCKKPQVDREWSRAVLACAATFFSSAVHSTSGFFYVAFMRQFGINRGAASWPISVFQAMDDLAGAFVTALQNYCAISTIALLGSVLFWAGILASVFAPDITWMTVTFGVIQGAGSGIMAVTVTMIMLMYFDKYRGFATGMRYSGYCFSSLLYPPILAFIDEAFPFRQMILLFGAISLHVTPVVLALKEPPWQRKSASAERPKTKRTSLAFNSSYSPEHKYNQAEQENNNKNVSANSRVRASVSSITDISADVAKSGTNGSNELKNALAEQVPMECVYNTKPITNGGASNVHGRLHSVRTGSRDAISIFTISVANAAGSADRREDGPEVARSETQHPACDMVSTHDTSSFENDVSAKTSYLRLILKPTFWAIVLGGVLADYTDCAFMATIVDSALDRGATRYAADLSIACSSPSQLLGRTVLPLVADVGLINRTSLASACSLLFATTMVGLAKTWSFATYAPCMVLASVFMGCLTTLKHVVIADYFGVDAVPVAWGATGVVLLPILLCNPPILGFFRDKQGAYDNLYYTLGFLHLTMAVVFLIIRCSSLKKHRKWNLKMREVESK